VEVSKEEVIACVEIPNDYCGRVKVFIPASAKVESFADSHARTSAPMSSTPRSSPCPYYLSREVCDFLAYLIREKEEDFPESTFKKMRDIYRACCM
ncbi:hypothetical protein KA005_70350, partial [bacterium]|nr:hypothetical protein [bacterium]